MIYVGDLNKTVTIGNVLDLFDDILDDARDEIQGEISDVIEKAEADWTDKKGLDSIHFTRDASSGIAKLIQDRLDALVEVADQA